MTRQIFGVGRERTTSLDITQSTPIAVTVLALGAIRGLSERG